MYPLLFSATLLIKLLARLPFGLLSDLAGIHLIPSIGIARAFELYNFVVHVDEECVFFV
jgi:hypothetical protein